MTNREQSPINDLISKGDLRKLANIHDQHCVSIYIPASHAGAKADRDRGQIALKNNLKKIKTKLKGYYLSDNEIEEYLSSVYDLLEDNSFWRKRSGCISIFLYKQQLIYFTLPIDQAEFNYVSDHLYLLPIMPLFSFDGKFYVLSLSLQDVKLYECTPHSIRELHVEDLVPGKLEEVVGSDYQDKTLQFRSGHGGSAGAMFHGQGAGKDDKDVEVEKFLRAVDKGLMKLLKNEDDPLILACVDQYQAVFAEITSYTNLYHKNIKGNHEEKPPASLHEMAWTLVKDYYLKQRNSMAKLLMDLSSSAITSFDLNDIIPAAIDGRVEVLFIQNNKDKYGLYDKVNRSLIIDEDVKVNQASLYNLAALQTWIQGGRVYLLDQDEMPFQHTSINALFRY